MPAVIQLCPHLGLWAVYGVLNFDCFAGLSLLPLCLLLCCTDCLSAFPSSSVYRFPGCLSAFIQDLPRGLQPTETVHELLRLLGEIGERKILKSLVGNEGENNAMKEVILALIGNTTPASDGSLHVSEASDFSSRNRIVNTGGRSPLEWTELPFSPIWTSISMEGVERLVRNAAPSACKVGIGGYDFVLPISRELKEKVVIEVIKGMEKERVFVPCDHLNSAIT